MEFIHEIINPITSDATPASLAMNVEGSLQKNHLILEGDKGRRNF